MCRVGRAGVSRRGLATRQNVSVHGLFCSVAELAGEQLEHELVRAMPTTSPARPCRGLLRTPSIYGGFWRRCAGRHAATTRLRVAPRLKTLVTAGPFVRRADPLVKTEGAIAPRE